MPAPAILIAPAELLPSLSAHLQADPSALQSFPDTDALRALEAITRTRPALVMLERRFSTTARGTALVSRIRADPSLTATEVRVVPAEGESIASPSGGVAAAARGAVAPQVKAAVRSAQELDYHGTRRAPRHAMRGELEILVDGNRSTLVDLSTYGAQILSATVLKPNQRVRLALSDSHGILRCSATIAWAAFEIPKGSAARYRAGLEFVDADATSVDAFALRHKQD